jgi:uncharacterized protein Smg (DUF494 family)
MKFLLVLMFIFTGAFAQDVQISKAQLREAIEAMRASGQFSQADIDKALKELDSMSDSKLKATVQAGVANANNPNVRAAAQNVRLQDSAEQKRLKDNYDPKKASEDIKKFQEIMNNQE